MKSESHPLPGPEFKPEDIDRIVAAYGQPVDPARKDAILATLRGERTAFDHARAQNSNAKTQPESGRG